MILFQNILVIPKAFLDNNPFLPPKDMNEGNGGNFQTS